MCREFFVSTFRGIMLIVATGNPQLLDPVVEKMDNPIQWINLYSVDNAIDFPNTYLLDSDLTGPSCSKLG